MIFCLYNLPYCYSSPSTNRRECVDHFLIVLASVYPRLTFEYGFHIASAAADQICANSNYYNTK